MFVFSSGNLRECAPLSPNLQWIKRKPVASSLRLDLTGASTRTSDIGAQRRRYIPHCKKATDIVQRRRL
jgi:hypothetical protein